MAKQEYKPNINDYVGIKGSAYKGTIVKKKSFLGLFPKYVIKAQVPMGFTEVTAKAGDLVKLVKDKI